MMSERSKRWNKKLGLCAGESCDVWAENFIQKRPKFAYAATAAIAAGLSAYALATVRGRFGIDAEEFSERPVNDTQQGERNVP